MRRLGVALALLAASSVGCWEQIDGGKWKISEFDIKVGSIGIELANVLENEISSGTGHKA